MFQFSPETKKFKFQNDPLTQEDAGKKNKKRMTDVYGAGSLRGSLQQPPSKSEVVLENHIQTTKKGMREIEELKIESPKMETPEA